MEPNNEAARPARLHALIDAASRVMPERLPTRPTRASQRRRVDEKVQRGRIKAMRGRVAD